jgi:archaellum biogenesis ATPase FlaH
MLSMVAVNGSAKSGIRDISDALGGGIRESSLVLIEGESSTGKSVLSQYIASGVLHSKDGSVAYYSTEYQATSLVAQMESISLEVGHELVTDRFRVYNVSLERVMEKPEAKLGRILGYLRELPGRFRLVVVDSPSPFMTRVGPTTKMSFLQDCKQLCEDDRSIVLTLDSHVLEGKSHSRAYEMSDYYLKLKTPDILLESGRVEQRPIKILEVTKMAGVERRNRAGIRFEVKPRIGIRILPFVQVKI